jgi:archaellum component FlaC
MTLIDKENVLTAQYMYVKRIEFLRSEVSRVVNRGIQLGEAYEEQTMSELDEIEEELQGIDECLELLKQLLWS